VQADGKILVGGAFTKLGGGGTGTTTRNYIGRLNADGSLDTTFNPGANNTVNALAVQADGKILVGGNFTMLGGGGTGTTTRNDIGRLNADGSLDTTFNPGADNSVSTLAVQADGKILVGGNFVTLGGQTRNYIGRLNADGSLDATFNPGADNTVIALAVQADGKILVIGTFGTLGGQARTAFGRLTADTAALQNLSADSLGQTLTWTRSGSGPEVWRATFEQSTDGTNYTLLGNGTRVAGGWQLTGQNLPGAQLIYLRARGYYSGSSSYGHSSLVESVRQIWIKANTTTTVATSGSPSTYGSAVTFTATVSGSPATPTGTVNFLDNGTTIGACNAQTLDGTGHATCTTSTLTLGTHSNITAVYGGDRNYFGSTSTALSQVVNCAPTVVVANANDSGAGSLRDAIANVCAGGTITFAGDTTVTPVSQLTVNKNLTIDGSGHTVIISGLLEFAANGALSGPLTANNIQIDNGQTLTANAGSTLNVTGNWTNNGTFVPGANAVTFNGSGAQTIGGTAASTFNNLIIANTGITVTLSQNATVNGALTLTSDLATTSATLTLGGTCAGTGDVWGVVARSGLTTGTSYCFGNPNVSLLFASGTLPNPMTVTLTPGAPVSANTAVQRKYTLTATGGSGYAATVRLHYSHSELNGNAEASLQLWRDDTTLAQWVLQGASARDTTVNWVEKSGVSQFSDWVLSGNNPTAITLALLKAQWQGKAVQVTWETASEINNLGYNLLRSTAQAGPYTKLNATLIPSGCFVCIDGVSYTWTDSTATAGKTYYYKLQAVDADGTVQTFGPVKAAPVCTTQPATPVLLTPADGSNFSKTQVKLDWNDRACATYYQVQVRQDSLTGTLDGTGNTLTVSEYLTPVLKRGHAYFWRVAACNALGCSAWTSWWNLRITY
ncbi:MAG: Ig-like domain repeat protein, partial [Anaerolineae bacterium]